MIAKNHETRKKKIHKIIVIRNDGNNNGYDDTY